MENIFPPWKNFPARYPRPRRHPLRGPPMKRALLLILAIAALALAAGTLNVRLLHQRTARQLTSPPLKTCRPPSP